MTVKYEFNSLKEIAEFFTDLADQRLGSAQKQKSRSTARSNLEGESYAYRECARVLANCEVKS